MRKKYKIALITIIILTFGFLRFKEYTSDTLQGIRIQNFRKTLRSRNRIYHSTKWNIYTSFVRCGDIPNIIVQM